MSYTYAILDVSPAAYVKLRANLEAAAGYTHAQGFVTSTGRFVDREEAARIAVAAGQLIPDRPNHRETVVRLQSEDVW